jgi:hypothetical protein
MSEKRGYQDNSNDRLKGAGFVLTCKENIAGLKGEIFAELPDFDSAEILTDSMLSSGDFKYNRLL